MTDSAENDAGRIIRASDGQDITEAVQILYDIAHSSMDWGSGFLDNEEMESVIRLAVLMGWQVPDLPDNSPAMVSTARKFPEHYEVTFRHIPKTQYSEAYDRPHIRVIPPADGRNPAPCPKCGEVCKYDGWGLVHANGIGIGSCPIPPGADLIGTCPDGSRCQAPRECVAARSCTRPVPPEN